MAERERKKKNISHFKKLSYSEILKKHSFLLFMEDKLNEKNIWMKCTTYEYQPDFKFVIEQKTHYQNLPKKTNKKTIMIPQVALL